MAAPNCVKKRFLKSKLRSLYYCFPKRVFSAFTRRRTGWRFQTFPPCRAFSVMCGFHLCSFSENTSFFVSTKAEMTKKQVNRFLLWKWNHWEKTPIKSMNWLIKTIGRRHAVSRGQYALIFKKWDANVQKQPQFRLIIYKPTVMCPFHHKRSS